jgi:hypothetical protein
MRDQFEPRDIKAEKYKTLFQDELRGPTLKKLDQFKRVAQVQSSWNKD